MRTVFSLLSIAPQHASRLFGDLLPYLAMLVAFTVFVAWNGGVVLGEFCLELRRRITHHIQVIRRIM
jgi:hypothetical protein